MSERIARQEALAQLRAALANQSPGFRKMVAAQPAVLARYQPLFKPENLGDLTREDFLSFLLFRNNQHWDSLHRQGPQMTEDMPRLRAALRALLDESRPIEQRLNDTKQGKKANTVPGLGRATITAILLVCHPEKYGVWNGTSQAGMQKLDLWPTFERGAPLGTRYAAVNKVLVGLARDLGIDLWTVDGLWWHILPSEGGWKPAAEVDEEAPVEASEVSEQMFGLERHLHDFLHDNWAKTSLGREWDLHTEDGEVVGYEYPTPIGRIDLLARHKKEKAWLVVELKRNQSSDDTVGQAMRYMGYVREHVAEKDDRVEGLIIAHEGDDRIRYALKLVPCISLMLYEVDFRLKGAGQ